MESGLVPARERKSVNHLEGVHVNRTVIKLWFRLVIVEFPCCLTDCNSPSCAGCRQLALGVDLGYIQINMKRFLRRVKNTKWDKWASCNEYLGSVPGTSGSSIVFGRAELCSGSVNYECPYGTSMCMCLCYGAGSWKPVFIWVANIREFSCILPQCSATIHERSITCANIFPMEPLPFLTWENMNQLIALFQKS